MSWKGSKKQGGQYQVGYAVEKGLCIFTSAR